MKIQEMSVAAGLLLRDEALGYPTETLYGLGCAALSSKALDRLCEWKPRDAQASPYPLIIGERAHLIQVVSAVSPLAEALMDAHWPGPLTLILPALPGLDPRICSPQGGVAVRLSSHPVAQALAQAIAQPIVSTSANPTGQPPPCTPDEVLAAFAPRDLPVFDGGVCAGGAPSTILSLLEAAPRLVRAGAISMDTLAPLLSLHHEIPAR